MIFETETIQPEGRTPPGLEAETHRQLDDELRDAVWDFENTWVELRLVGWYERGGMQPTWRYLVGFLTLSRDGQLTYNSARIYDDYAEALEEAFDMTAEDVFLLYNKVPRSHRVRDPRRLGDKIAA